MCFIAQGTGEPCSTSVRQTPVSSPVLKLPLGRQHAAVLAEVRNYPMIYFIPEEQQQQLSKKQWQVRSSRPVEPTRFSILTPPITQIKHPHRHPVLIPRPLGQSNCVPQRPGGSRVWRDRCPCSGDRSGGRHSLWPPGQWDPPRTLNTLPRADPQQVLPPLPLQPCYRPHFALLRSAQLLFLSER